MARPPGEQQRLMALVVVIGLMACAAIAGIFAHQWLVVALAPVVVFIFADNFRRHRRR